MIYNLKPKIENENIKNRLKMREFKNKFGFIYLITNIVNKKKYIGATTREVEVRFKQHICSAKNNTGCRLMMEAINQFGEDNFVVETILKCNLEHLYDYETKMILFYDSISPNGYNLKTGGNLGSKYSEETKKRIGDIQKGKFVSEKTRVLTGKKSKYRNMNENNKEKIKRALEKLNLENLPMYIVYSIDKRNNRNVDVIEVKIPNQKKKKFAKKNMSLEEKIKLAIIYKESFSTQTVIGSSAKNEELKV